MAGSRAKAVNALAQEQQLMDMPRQRQWAEEDRATQTRINDITLQTRQLALDAQRRALESGPEEREITLDYPNFSIIGPKSAIAKLAGEVAAYPDQADGPEFQEYAASLGVSFKRSPSKAPKEAAPSQLGKLIAERDSLPEGDARRQLYDAAISKEATRSGMVIESDGKGGFTIRTNAEQGGGPTAITKKTQGDIEGKIITGSEQLARLKAISDEFKPEYQQLGTRWDALKTSLKSRAGMETTPEEKQLLTGFKKYQRKAIENINLYIKELTGAQMSEKEADRLRLAQPDPGENWWSGDDPITFKAKLDDTVRYARAAVARYEYYRSKGLGPDSIRAIINSGTAIPLDSLAANMD